MSPGVKSRVKGANQINQSFRKRLMSSRKKYYPDTCGDGEDICDILNVLHIVNN